MPRNYQDMLTNKETMDDLKFLNSAKEQSFDYLLNNSFTDSNTEKKTDDQTV